MFDSEAEDGDFANAAGSKLSTLFGQEKTKENSNPSLVYTPPKKPKPTEQLTEMEQNSSNSSPAAVPKFSVVIADIVHSFKLEAGVYKDQRKVGVAVLGNAQAQVFQILLYRTTSAGKQDYIAVAKITEGFHFEIQPKFYCSFYDDAKNNWSLVFNCQESCMQFARQVGAAKFRAVHGKSVVTQRIDPGDEGTFKGESTHLTISQQYFDINSISPYTSIEATIKVSLNPSQAKWSEGLVSASPGSKYAIFIPMSTTLPWASSVSPSPLVLEVIVEKMLNTPSPPAAEQVKEKLTSGSEDGSVQSLAKDSLISRVARMGRATLPLKGVSYPSDSETEEENSSQPSPKSQLKPKYPKSRSAAPKAGGSSHSDQSYIAKSAVPASSVGRPGAVMNFENKLVQYLPGDGQMVPIASQYQLVTTASAVTSPSEPMTMFVSESRIQNTEMRMNMNRIVDKIDVLSTKVDALSSNATARPAISNAAMDAISNATMDAASLLNSVKKIVKDNQDLTAEVAEKNEKINELNQRIFSLVDNNAKIFEQSRVLLEEKQKVTEAGDAQAVLVQKQQIEALESEKTAYLQRIAELESRLEAIEESNSILNRSKTSELNAKDDELSAKLSELVIKDSEVSDLKNALSAKEAELEATIRECNNLRTSAEQGHKRVKEVEEKCERYEADNSELKDLVTSLSVNISDLESTISHMTTVEAEEKNKTKKCEEAVAQLQKKLVTHMRTQLAEAGFRRAVDYESTVTDIKLLMNKVYRKISQYFDVNATVSGGVVRQTVAVVLKSEVTQFADELLMKNRPAITNNVPADPDKTTTVREPPANPTVPAVHPVERPTKPEEPVVPVEPRSDSEVKTVPKVSGAEDAHARSRNEFWRSEPPPVPKFEEEDDNEDWLNV